MSIEFSALDGANPLAFLTSLGVLRVVHSAGVPVKMRWVRTGIWHPELVGVDDAVHLCALLAERAKSELPIAEFEALGKNITVSPDCFAQFVTPAYDEAKNGDRKVADFAAAFGSEVFTDDKGRIEYTDLCFITGSGHQHFLGTMKGLSDVVTEEHIRDALFGKWERL